MDTDPAAENHVNRLAHTSPNELATKLPLLFKKILDPDLHQHTIWISVCGCNIPSDGGGSEFRISCGSGHEPESCKAPPLAVLGSDMPLDFQAAFVGYCNENLGLERTSQPIMARTIKHFHPNSIAGFTSPPRGHRPPANGGPIVLRLRHPCLWPQVLDTIPVYIARQFDAEDRQIG